MKSALFICDPGWSTGNIVKGLQATLPDWHIEMHDWREGFMDHTHHDAVVCLSMTGPARNPHWCTKRIAHVLCGPGELDLPEVRVLRLPPGIVLGGVSRECADLIRAAYPQADSVHVIPGFAHPGVFTFRDRPDTPIHRAGFVGSSVTQNMQVSGPAKRPEMFREICEKAGVEAVFSEQKYHFEDMQQFYDSIDVLISTSTREGGPFSPIEAIACGVPALSTDVGVIRDLGLPGRFFVTTECVDMIPSARKLLARQYEIVTKHTRQAVPDWDLFLHRAAIVRRSQ